MATKEAVLVEALVNAASNTGNRMLERRMADLAVWIYQNKGRIPIDNLASRQAFHEKALWCLLEVVALQHERIQDLEASKRSKHLWMPSSVSINGSVKDYG
jgi:hypothetical protein